MAPVSAPRASDGYETHTLKFVGQTTLRSKCALTPTDKDDRFNPARQTTSGEGVWVRCVMAVSLSWVENSRRKGRREVAIVGNSRQLVNR